MFGDLDPRMPFERRRQVIALLNPFAWYPLDDPDGVAIVRDLSGNNAHGSYMTGAVRGPAISRARTSYQPRGLTTNYGWTIPSDVWTRGASADTAPNGWIVSVFLAKDASVTGGSVVRFLWGDAGGSGNQWGPTEQGNYIRWYVSTEYVSTSGSLPLQPVDTTITPHMYTLCYRRDYAARGVAKYQCYRDGVVVATTNPNSAATPATRTGAMRCGSPDEYANSYGNFYRMAHMISAPAPESVGQEAAAITRLYALLAA